MQYFHLSVSFRSSFMTWLNSEMTQVLIMKFPMIAHHPVRILGIALQATTRCKYLVERLTQAYLRLKSLTKVMYALSMELIIL